MIFLLKNLKYFRLNQDIFFYKYLYDRIWSDAELLDGFHEHEIKDIIAKTKDKFGAEINHFVAVALEKVANEKLNENEQG